MLAHRRLIRLSLACVVISAGLLTCLGAVGEPRARRAAELTPVAAMYLPVMYRQYASATVTPTATATLTPAPTLTPTIVAPGIVYTVTVAPGGGIVFAPTSSTIHVGDTVRWIWGASGHTVTSGVRGVADGRFCAPNDTSCAASPALPIGTVYEHHFDQIGTYDYFCRPHWSLGMTGQIIVLPQGAAAGPS